MYEISEESSVEHSSTSQGSSEGISQALQCLPAHRGSQAVGAEVRAHSSPAASSALPRAAFTVRAFLQRAE